jgi:hypothetical protein
MAYLIEEDYSISISSYDLHDIIESARSNTGLSWDTIRGNAEAWAKAIIKSYLSAKYDTAAEFAITATAPPPAEETPDTRNAIIKQVMVDLALCQMHKAINPRDIPELREKACDASIQWLKDARDGKVVVDLDPAPVPAGQTAYNRTHIGSQAKFISKPFSDRSVIGDDDE